MATEPDKKAASEDNADNERGESAATRSPAREELPPPSPHRREDHAVVPTARPSAIATTRAGSQRYPIGSTGLPPTRTSKWTWSPKQWPLQPTAAIVCP